jgi:hypothetical protein
MVNRYLLNKNRANANVDECNENTGLSVHRQGAEGVEL